MKELDIRKDIPTRKIGQTKTIYYKIYRNVMKITSRKYHPHYEIIDDINKCDGPAIVMFNHLSRLDHTYVNEICYPRKVNMVAGYNEFFRSHLHWVFKHNNCIPKKNYCQDLQSIKGMMRILSLGGAFSFAPEGLASNDGINKPIVPGTGHLLKKFNVPVYFVRLDGQYLQNTKNCLDERYGETYASIRILFTKDDLERLSVEEIDDVINEACKSNQFIWQKEKHIRWKIKNKNVCQDLHTLLYKCPKCGKEFSMIGKDNYIKCNECGNGAIVDDYYDFTKIHEDDKIFDIQTDWTNWERMEIIKEIREDKNYKFEERVKIGMLPNDHYVKHLETSEIVSQGLLTIDHNGIRFVSDDGLHNFESSYKQTYTAFTVKDMSYISIYVDGEYYDIIPSRPSAYKMLVLFEEMHRLHVNYYKNLKEYDYMYE